MTPETLALCSDLLANKIAQVKMAGISGVLIHGNVFTLAELEAHYIGIMGTIGRKPQETPGNASKQ